MGALRTTLSDGLTHLIVNWKSTAQGFLTIGLATATTLLPLGILSPKQTVWAVAAQALCKAYIAIITKDAK